MAALILPLRLWRRRVGRREPEPGVAREAGVRPPVLTLTTDGAGQLTRPRYGRRAGAARVVDAARAAAAAERRRLARELHDSISQTLIGLQLTAQAAADLLDSQPAQARAALDTIRHLAAGATTELRAVLLDLHDEVLERQGLVAALEAYCALVRQRSGLRVELHLQEVGPASGVGTHQRGERLSAAQEEALYSLVREALTNVVKHARATRATVTLALDPRPCACVEDDGVGFGAPPRPSPTGWRACASGWARWAAGCGLTTGRRAGCA